MTERYKNYSRRKFKAWKDRVKRHLPELAFLFYSAKRNGTYFHYENEMLLGRVILYLNDPSYSLVDKQTGKPENQQSQMAAEIMLEILVKELFALLKFKRSKVD